MRGASTRVTCFSSRGPARRLPPGVRCHWGAPLRAGLGFHSDARVEVCLSPVEDSNSRTVARTIAAKEPPATVAVEGVDPAGYDTGALGSITMFVILLACAARQTTPAASTDALAAFAQPSGADPICGGRPMTLVPVALSEQDAALRWGNGVSAVADLSSSHDQPVEVCGVAGERRFLLALSCPDGTHPFQTDNDARMARAGSVGQGGRCGSTIDLYRVACSAQTLDVYMDMYMCAPSESFQ